MSLALPTRTLAYFFPQSPARVPPMPLWDRCLVGVPNVDNVGDVAPRLIPTSAAAVARTLDAAVVLCKRVHGYSCIALACSVSVSCTRRLQRLLARGPFVARSHQALSPSSLPHGEDPPSSHVQYISSSSWSKMACPIWFHSSHASCSRLKPSRSNSAIRSLSSHSSCMCISYRRRSRNASSSSSCTALSRLAFQ